MSLADFKKALGRTDEIELTVVSRTSGRETSRPVWFVQEDDTFMLGANEVEVVARPSVRLLLRGRAVDDHRDDRERNNGDDRDAL